MIPHITIDEAGVPVVATGTGDSVAVASIVHACHERAIDDGLAELAVPGLSRETLEPLLVYCAEMRCEAAGGICPGCRRETQAAGIKSLDDYVSRLGGVVPFNFYSLTFYDLDNGEYGTYTNYDFGSMRASKSKPGWGIVVIPCELVNQDDQVVHRGEHRLMIPRRPDAAA